MMPKIHNLDKRPVIVYRHRRLDTNEIFYVGIAVKLNRPYSKKGRNKFWHNIVSKTDYSVEIIITVDNWEQACELEELLIQEYGRRNIGKGNLVNMTNGGDGRFGSIISDITKVKMSKAKLGLKLSKETCTNISNGKKGKQHSEEGKNKKVKALGKKIIDTNTQIVYNSITEASIFFNLPPSTISRYVNGKRKNKTNLKLID